MKTRHARSAITCKQVFAQCTLLGVGVLSLSACSKSCKNDRPYVPYVVAEGLDAGASGVQSGASRALDASAAAAAGGSASDGGTSANVDRVDLAPPGASVWTLRDVTLKAPPGTEFVSALVNDFDGDGSVDALALARPSVMVVAGDPSASRADERSVQLLHYPGNAPSEPPRGVVQVPAAEFESGREASCRPIAQLAGGSGGLATVEIGEQCTTLSASRRVFVVRLGARPAPVLEFAVVDPAGAAALTLTADGSDRDSDGIGDVALSFAMGSKGPPFEPAPPVTARAVLLDRPAGLSRLPDEPEASFKALAASLQARSNKAREASAVATAADQVRDLYRALCTESGEARVVQAAHRKTGASAAGFVTCGAAKHLESAALAELRAWVSAGDPFRAVLAASRIASVASPVSHAASRPTKSARVGSASSSERAHESRDSRDSRGAEVAALLSRVAPLRAARFARTLGVAIGEQSASFEAMGRDQDLARDAASPGWANLAFDPRGPLLVREVTRVLRIDPESGAALDGPSVEPWAREVASPDGSRKWLGVVAPCEGSFLIARFSGANDRDAEAVGRVPIPIRVDEVGALGQSARVRCVPGQDSVSVNAQPLAWKPGGFEAWVAGRAIVFAGDRLQASVMLSPIGEASSPLGSARSPGGTAVAMPASDSVVVRVRAKGARLRAAEFEPYSELTQCALDDGAAHVACLKRDGRIVIAAFEGM